MRCSSVRMHMFKEHGVGQRCVWCNKLYESIQKEAELALKQLQPHYVKQLDMKQRRLKRDPPVEWKEMMRNESLLLNHSLLSFNDNISLKNKLYELPSEWSLMVGVK